MDDLQADLHLAGYAQVILDIPSRAIDSLYDYQIPDELSLEVAVGCAVLVDFNNRPALGYVAGVSATPLSGLELKRIKPVREVLSTAHFTEAQFELADWIAREYLSPISETIKLFAPPGSLPRLRRDYSGGYGVSFPAVGPVDDRWVRLTEAGAVAELPARASRQREILEALRAGELRVSELGLSVQNATSSLRALERRGLVEIESRRRMRGQLVSLPPSQDIIDLTAGQRDALAAIRTALKSAGVEVVAGVPGSTAAVALAGTFNAAGASGATSAAPASAGATTVAASAGAPATTAATPTPSPSSAAPLPILIDGVTGSGKTEVYLQAIRDVLEAGGSAIVLVPEISLTPQTVARFRSRFGEQVAVLHSRLKPGERYDQWDMLRSGAARVVVGARSALFAPLKNLKLIIIDEEHESTYKQNSTPRYTTRSVARQLAKTSEALLVLGSATPSLEALTAVKRGQMQRVLLPERPNRRPLPPIQVVDLSHEFKAGNKSMFSAPLHDALLQTIDRGEKAILLLNRRGYASFLLCRDCGYVPTCENCSTSLTFHEHPPRLVCHHCGENRAVPARCPDCESPYLRQLGPGTQYAYDQLVELLPPDTAVVRMDADSTRGRYGHEARLNEFASAKRAVLLGTQMIAKGLDFPDVTLVGVLIADTALKLPDFRAAERTYQLLEQVAGRAGRDALDGQVIVQTYWPDHLAIRAAAAHDRDLLFVEEERLRAEFGYPPFARLANILLWSESLEDVTRAAGELAELLRASLPDGVKLLGPSPCVISRRQSQHRWHVLVKAPLGFDLPGWLASVLSGSRAIAGVSRAIDIDPYDLM